MDFAEHIESIKKSKLCCIYMYITAHPSCKRSQNISYTKAHVSIFIIDSISADTLLVISALDYGEWLRSVKIGW